MGTAMGASVVYLPGGAAPYPTLIDFLCRRFPKVAAEVWRQRLATGKIRGEDGFPVGPDTAYRPDSRLFYHREVAEEPVIPFIERILWEDQHLLAVDKPPFLPVSPIGPYVAESLVERLKRRTGYKQLSPLHRIDRETSGLVLLAKDPHSRGRYQRLFAAGLVHKTYEAICVCQPSPEWLEMTVENRLEPGEPWFLMRVCPGQSNARSHIRVIEVQGGRARLLLTPISGKKHQLRLHLSGLGLPIEGDKFYPTLQPAAADDFRRPLQLLAKSVEFPDPHSGHQLRLDTGRSLSLALDEGRFK
jgi:tRNA pseudouridine32 synthase/23S rRNA pseudouridine746 synthase